MRHSRRGSASVSPGERPAPPDNAANDPLSRPIFVVAPPRAGGRLIARALDAVPRTWNASGAEGALLSGIPDLDPPDGRGGGRLVAADCRAEVRHRLLSQLRAQAPASGALGHSSPRLFDAAPRNA